ASGTHEPAARFPARPKRVIFPPRTDSIGRLPMRLRHSWLGAVLIAAALAPGGASAQTALGGIVTSSEEGAMESALVRPRKDGATITTTVVTDAQGRYEFPAERLTPGKYSISIRAIGYRLDGAKAVEVPAGGAGSADLKLSKVKSLVPQLSSGEWLASLPAPDKQKAFLTMCVGCHTPQRALTATPHPPPFPPRFLP